MRSLLWLLTTLWAALPMLAPDAQHQMPMPMPGQHQMAMPNTAAFLMREASGTSLAPASAPSRMLMRQYGAWRLMAHGVAFITDTQQTGARGHDKFFSTNWLMGMAEHRAGESGSVMFRAMLSLEPATITERRYPELFQTGETAFGRPIVDGQHPHDFVMELSVQYARQLDDNTLVTFYAAPVGDPALGPVAFPHRLSAMELPQAPLSHHVQDSTHIANDVITLGINRGPLRLEASGFHGAEPDEARWNIDYGTIDSWSARVAATPGRNWAAQASLGRLRRPEALEPGDIIRSTASVTYNRPLASGNWATTLIWGRNHKTATAQNINSYLAESVLSRGRNHVTGRIELVDKEELFSDQPAVEQVLARTAGSVFRIGAYTLGYTRDVNVMSWMRTGLGGNFTLYTFPVVLQQFYGDHPVSFYLYLRFRLG